jgi:flagellar motor switch protein FliN/FliY
MRLREVMNLLPGAIVDLAKDAGSELDLLVNNEIVASGTAVKVGENFGIRVSSVGTTSQRAEGPDGTDDALDDAEVETQVEVVQSGEDQ